MEFRGGTYITQKESSNIADATIRWAKDMDVRPIKHFALQSKNELLEDLVNNYPLLFDKVHNVWCISFALKVGFVLVNIVQTDKS